jgi:amino acid transporter
VTTYRIPRPHAGIIPVSATQFEATEYAEQRVGWRGRFLNAKDLVVGSSMSNARLAEERLSKKVALAIFSSDALSSTAYATQEILLILVIAGSSLLSHSIYIAAAITLLLGIVVISYRQTIRAYPNGGGAYIVAHENLGMWPGLVAAASLLIDYVLTVAVSIAACVEAITSASPDVGAYAVPLAVGLVLLIALGNLRGLRESGTVFSIPTYGFVLILSITLITGFAKVIFGDDPNIFRVGTPHETLLNQEPLTWFLIARAFAAGCTALTGVEAISNGVTAFKEPQAKNAATTLTAMALILGALFLGTTLLARHLGLVFTHDSESTVMAQIGEDVFGRNILFYALQTFTAGILFLAANTSYNGFPLLAAILARDGYLPRFFHQRGNRLVFSYGIFVLTAFSILLLVAFEANTTKLIPLYALGVFLSFTLAQAGMVRRWTGRKELGWKRSAMISGVGAAATAVVFVIILVTKFLEGGFMAVIALALIAPFLWSIGSFYKRLARLIHVPPQNVFDMSPRGKSRTPVLVPVDEINLPTVTALSAACERSSNVTAVHVNYDVEDGDELIKRWHAQFPGIPLVVINSPYRTVAEPLSWYVADRLKQWPGAIVMLPVIEVSHWYQRPLVNQSLRRLKTLLKRRKTVEFIEQPFGIG